MSSLSHLHLAAHDKTLGNDKEKEEYINANVAYSCVKEVPGLIVSDLGIDNIGAQLKDKPCAEKNGDFVENLNPIAQFIHHGHHLNVVDKERC